MKKLFYLIAIFFATETIGQKVATGIVKYNKLNYPAYVYELDAGTDQVESAIKEYFIGQGVRTKENHGFLVYRNIQIPSSVQKNSGANGLLDAIIKIERSGKKDENKSKVYVILTKPGSISDDKPGKDQKALGSNVVLAAGGAELFTNLKPSVNKHVYLKELADLEATISKNDKALFSLDKKRNKLQRELEKLQQEIVDNEEEACTLMEENLKQIEILKQKKASPPEGS